MKKFFGSAAFLALFGLYSLYHYPDALGAARTTSGSGANTAVTSGSTGTLASAQSSPPPTSFTNDDDNNPLDENGESSSQQTTQTPQSAPAQTTTPAPKPKPTGQYKDGSYTGSSIYVYYGNVQVRATISGGKLTDVQFLQYPNDRRESQQINREAMPYLTQEALQTQSANVSGVSGASDTSEGFRQSLAAALSQAKS